VLDRDLEGGLRLSLLWPTNLARLLAGGVNDRSNLADTLDRDVFGGATFADLFRRNKPNVWINATDLYNRTPFPFMPPLFLGLCSDLSQLRVSEAVAASMAVPLAFAPVVLRTFPEQCLTPLPSWLAAADDDTGSVAAGIVGAAARAVRNYRDPARMRYVKLADGGLTDNQGLASILIARAVSGTPYGPLTELDALRMRQMLFFIVDAGRPAGGDWAFDLGGPSGFDVGIAAADAAIDSATRLSAAAFRQMAQQWQADIVRYRCGLSPARVAELLGQVPNWRCDDLVIRVDTISIESLGRVRADRLASIPTRLVLPKSDIDAAIAAGRDAAQSSQQLSRYLERRKAAAR
jgi:NTE family protein